MNDDAITLAKSMARGYYAQADAITDDVFAALKSCLLAQANVLMKLAHALEDQDRDRDERLHHRLQTAIHAEMTDDVFDRIMRDVNKEEVDAPILRAKGMVN